MSVLEKIISIIFIKDIKFGINLKGIQFIYFNQN